MKVRRFSDLQPYTAPGHYDMRPLRVHGNDVSGSEILTLGLSHFLPGGGAEFSPVNPGVELIYYIIEGELTIGTDSETFVLKAGDSIFLKEGDGRSVKNETNRPASMLVVLGKKLERSA